MNDFFKAGQYWETWLNQWFYRLLLLGILINASGLYLTILEPDGALYALIAKTIAQTGDFINLKLEGKDWLDKPHFPFWMAALSFKLFGINTFAYKFPALLFWGMGIWYTYRFAFFVYGKGIAQLAVLIYITAAHLFLSNNDVRAEPYLTALIIGSVFHYHKADQTNSYLHTATGSLLAACAVMTKGPFVLITIGGGFVLNWIVKKQWKAFVHPRWWMALVLIAIFILPELYCLYIQFDLHPEKTVFGKTGISGLRFFFWDSQFGRFFNTGPIKGNGDPFFYFHTFLWAFLPWSLLLFAAMAWKIKNFNKSLVNHEYISMGGLVLSFIVFSLSRFQLPHYIILLFPFCAIITAQYLYKVQKTRTERTISRVQDAISILLIVLVIGLSFFFKPAHSFVLGFWIVLLVFLAILFFRKRNLPAALGRSFMIAVLVYGFLNFFFYPALLKYQSGSEAAFYVNKLKPAGKVGMFREDSYSFAFYSKTPVHYWNEQDLKTIREPVFIFTRKTNLDSLSQNGFQTKILHEFEHFHISQLTGTFINAKTRSTVTENYVVGEIRPDTGIIHIRF
jgi:4-amino-4-deoxy-L-arabinose transferase-like glycosyltransferase